MPLPDLKDVLPHYSVAGIHPAAELFPLPSEEDFSRLVQSLREHGLGEDIVIDEQRRILDGRSRLMACYEAHVDPRYKTYKGDPYILSVTANLDRRHLTTGQKAMVADSLRGHFEEEAKKRQQAAGRQTGLANGANASANISGSIDDVSQKGESRAQAASQVGVGKDAVDKARTIREHAPEVAAKVVAGEITLEKGFQEAKKRKTSVESQPVDTPVKTKSEATARIIKVDGSFKEVPLPKNVSFNRTNGNVEWASWTWNPVTGCNHGCKFCYAREIAHSPRMENAGYPFKFEPAFHEYRLTAPKNTSVPSTEDQRDGRVFVCSMADLFGKWVPEEWIEAVFSACLESPAWEYLFLTKWPARYSQMPLLQRAWYGASIIKQSDVLRVQDCMVAFNAPGCVKWISLEPLLEPIAFSDLSWCDLVVIGSQTSTNQPDGPVPEFAPEFEWIVDIVNQCRDAGVPYYLKPNVGREAPGMRLPKMQPRRAAR